MIHDSHPISDLPTHVVCVGASAGGLEALEKFFESMPLDTGMAFAVVQHLSPDFKSVMDELLSRFTNLKIVAVEDGMDLVRDTIYLMPPRVKMTIEGNCLRLTAKKATERHSLPIDHFLESLADQWKERSVAVILSGTGSDGTTGICHIARTGGLVMAQSIESAQFDGMPRSAEQTGLVDLILSSEDLGEVLGHYAMASGAGKQKFLAQFKTRDSDSVSHLFSLLHTKYQLDFNDYKPNTIARRIDRRILLTDSAGFAEYIEKVTEDEVELETLYNDLLICVTNFFRDPTAFATLKEEVLPSLLKENSPSGQLRVWVAGCSTGEEVYSLAIAICELKTELNIDVDVKIFATDINKINLEIASQGIYSNTSMAAISQERKKRFFTKLSVGYQVVADLRQMVVFAPHNLAVDAPFTKIDLITCRNLLIYLQQSVQNKIISLFHFALKKEGVLFLGPSESLGSVSASFEVVNQNWKLYRKTRDSSIPTGMLTNPTSTMQYSKLPVSPRAITVKNERGLSAAYDKLLDHFIPTGILLNDQRELVHVFGDAAEFVQLRAGRPSNDAIELIPSDLQPALKGAIHRATRDMKHIKLSGLRVPEVDSLVSMGVLPIADETGKLTHIMITFEKLNIPVIDEELHLIHGDELSSDRMKVLEGELNTMRDNLQSTVEELETSNEELQATNEEMVASNEELQSTNEELHSVNEELYTVNIEYQSKIAELTVITNDIDHVFAHLDVGMVFLDKELNIRKFNLSVSSIFSLQPQDIGRYFGSFTHTLVRPKLLEDIRNVMENETPFEKEVKDLNGQWYVLRIHAYRSGTEIDGAVLELVNVSDVKKSHSQLRKEIHQLKMVIDHYPKYVCITDLDGQYVFMNEGYARFSGLDRANLHPENYHHVLPGDAPQIAQAAEERVLQTGQEVTLSEPVLLGPKLTPCNAMKFPIRNEKEEIEAIGTVIYPVALDK